MVNRRGKLVLTFLYYASVSLLFTHEMDAVRQAEWRLLLVLRSLDDETAFAAFLAVHVPLFFLFLWLGHHRNTRVRSSFRALVSLFLVVHGGLHYLLSGADAYGFAGPLSNGLSMVRQLPAQPIW